MAVMLYVMQTFSRVVYAGAITFVVVLLILYRICHGSQNDLIKYFKVL